jgi:hypothetical protein
MSFLSRGPSGVKPNRHARRKAAAVKRARKDYYHTYVRHLPQVPPDAAYERGCLTHVTYHHDDWCRFFESGRAADCNCSPQVTYHREPRRS